MVAKWVETITGSLDQKKQYKRVRARLEALPGPYRAAAHAVNRYFMYYGGISDGDILIKVSEDLVDMWERAVLDGVSVREIVGDDPVEFAESFAQASGGRSWIDKERARLITAIDEAEREDQA